MARFSHDLAWIPLVFFVLSIAGCLVSGSIRKSAESDDARSRWRILNNLSGVLFVPTFLFFGFCFIHGFCASLAANGPQCVNNLKRLSTAQILYSADYDDHSPIGPDWMNQISGYRADGEFSCPEKARGASYAMNRALAGVSLNDVDPQQTVLQFESDQDGMREASAVAQERHRGIPNFGLADGSVRRATPYVQKKLKWLPYLPSDADSGQRR